MCAKHSVKVLVEAVVVIMAFSGLCVNYFSIFFPWLLVNWGFD